MSGWGGAVKTRKTQQFRGVPIKRTHSVFPPEKVGQTPGCYEYELKYIDDRSVHYDTVES
jgi:hypothetical protein